MKIKFGVVLIITILLSNFLPAQTVVVTEKNDKVFLWIEAEAGNIIDPMLIHDTEKASGGQFIEVRGGNNNVENAPNDVSNPSFSNLLFVSEFLTQIRSAFLKSNSGTTHMAKHSSFHTLLSHLALFQDFLKSQRLYISLTLSPKITVFKIKNQ